MVLAAVLGGVGLFLLGMHLMTAGLQAAAGEALRGILARGTRTRMRGLLSGAALTGVVQSSSAVTVATIGFVNAGLLGLAPALAVVYGANVGTTATSWLVAAAGFHLDLKALALPLVGVGALLRLAARGVRIAGLGEALAGFGLVFLGIDALRGGFEGLAARVDFSGLGADPTSLAVSCLVGAALTVLMQSSSAAMALVLTAVGGGLVAVEPGAAMVVGANIGTTSTAALASIGATSGARRVAAGHAAFNLLTGAVALATLPLLLLAMDRLRGALALSGEPAAVLAGFHTVFNLLGVALMWPLTDRLVGFLERRFRTREEDEARPRHLDANVARTPLAGLRAMALELMRAHAHVRRMAALAIEEGPRALERVRTSRVATTRLLDAIGGFSTSLQRGRMSDAPGEALPETLRVLRHVAEAAELAEAVAAAAPAEWLPRPLDDERRAFEAEVAALLATAVPDAAKPGPEEIGRAMERVDAGYHALKSHLLRAGAGGDLGVGTLVAHLDRLSDVRRTAQQLERGARRLRAVMALLEGAEPPPTPADGAAGA